MSSDYGTMACLTLESQLIHTSLICVETINIDKLRYIFDWPHTFMTWLLAFFIVGALKVIVSIVRIVP